MPNTPTLTFKNLPPKWNIHVIDPPTPIIKLQAAVCVWMITITVIVVSFASNYLIYSNSNIAHRMKIHDVFYWMKKVLEYRNFNSLLYNYWVVKWFNEVLVNGKRLLYECKNVYLQLVFDVLYYCSYRCRTPNRIKIVRYMLSLQIYMLVPLTFEYYVSYLAGWL